MGCRELSTSTLRYLSRVCFEKDQRYIPRGCYNCRHTTFTVCMDSSRSMMEPDTWYNINLTSECSEISNKLCNVLAWSPQLWRRRSAPCMRDSAQQRQSCRECTPSKDFVMASVTCSDMVGDDRNTDKCPHLSPTFIFQPCSRYQPHPHHKTYRRNILALMHPSQPF